MHTFVSGPLFQFAALQQAYKNCPAGSSPFTRRGADTATSRGAARPSSPPPPAAASARLRRRCVRLLRNGCPRRRRPRRPSPARSSPRRRRHCCKPLLRRGRPSRLRPPRSRLCRNSTAGKASSSLIVYDSLSNFLQVAAYMNLLSNILMGCNAAACQSSCQHQVATNQLWSLALLCTQNGR